MCPQSIADGFPRNFAGEGASARRGVSVGNVREVTFGGVLLRIEMCVEINPKHKYCGDFLHSLHPWRDPEAERLCPCGNRRQVRPYSVVCS